MLKQKLYLALSIVTALSILAAPNAFGSENEKQPLNSPIFFNIEVTDASEYTTFLKLGWYDSNGIYNTVPIKIEDEQGKITALGVQQEPYWLNKGLYLVIIHYPKAGTTYECCLEKVGQPTGICGHIKTEGKPDWFSELLSNFGSDKQNQVQAQITKIK